MIFNIIAATAEAKEGIAQAKAAGKYKGRAPTARRLAAEIRARAAEGVPLARIARDLGIGRSSVYRCLSEPVEARALDLVEQRLERQIRSRGDPPRQYDRRHHRAS